MIQNFGCQEMMSLVLIILEIGDRTIEGIWHISRKSYRGSVSYTVAWRCGCYFLVVKTIFYERVADSFLSGLTRIKVSISCYLAWMCTVSHCRFFFIWPECQYSFPIAGSKYSCYLHDPSVSVTISNHAHCCCFSIILISSLKKFPWREDQIFGQM